MPRPFPNLPPGQRGTLITLQVASKALIGNWWSDPHVRDVIVYTPPGYQPGQALPAVLVLPAFAGTGEGLLARSLGEVSVASRIDRLISQGCPPFLAVLPDAMTSLGGSQYVDSPAIGNYATFLSDDVRLAVEAAFEVSAWGAVGRSSGGYGALHLALHRPGFLRAIGASAPDLGFDLCYLEDIAQSIHGVRRAGGAERFVAEFWASQSPPPAMFAALNVIAMACAYSPDTSRKPLPARLPVDFETGEVDFEVIRSWRRLDPLAEVATSAEARDRLKALDGMFLDAGKFDEHGLQFGLQRFVKVLGSYGIPHEHEEFAGGHRGTSHRYDWLLPQVVAALGD